MGKKARALRRPETNQSSTVEKVSQRVSPVFALIGLAMAAGVIYLVGEGELTPVHVPSNGSTYEEEMRWGSYRPNVYFGMAMKEKDKILTGLMWGSGMAIDQMRHTCDHGDRLHRFGWTSHDGRTFGEHIAEDRLHGLKVTASFVKSDTAHVSGGSWANRVTAERVSGLPYEPSSAVFVYYVTLPDGCVVDLENVSAEGMSQVRLNGHCQSIGKFSLLILERSTVSSNDVPKHPSHVERLSADLKKYCHPCLYRSLMSH